MIHSIQQDARNYTHPLPDFIRSVNRSRTIGLIDNTELQTVNLDGILLLVSRLANQGVASLAKLQLDDSLRIGELPGAYWRDINAALDHSPMPKQEWKSAQELFQDNDLIAQLTGVARSSVGRYIRGERATPDEVSERLHAVMMIAADLQGVLNPQGVRRWFTKRRSHLDGLAPIDVLGKDWTTDSSGYARVRTLADSDLSFQAT
ncbi:hypothetical protein [Deinococcus soli (ex Cha et al. 2016)]|uniref:Antitoxin Xre/MbcA/ParS-like toxin-binding domain-containing protein n=2 Tax=Deinococcus soli (ex Cha et al. 2016) TaxID=1309411 RepID=A0AAE3XEX3_9DEIO|nr:hypothetical protein [Deinococcus soli (ex Cha et al. 2016)]MDR6218860.1 hypothetical protein [Deinococcus soli (ex Cha et al. 2016)]MDR6328657.1 hypothetical protein [Deinococcus soli (ex Cha et al. 2016)]MDR6751856.1 hypothetical protein [Deinococcus soli (ex Cha et al. 2016)]